MCDACISEGANEGSAVLEGDGAGAESVIAAAAAGACMDETPVEDGGMGWAEGWAAEAAARASCAGRGKPNSNEPLRLETDAG